MINAEDQDALVDNLLDDMDEATAEADEADAKAENPRAVPGDNDKGISAQRLKSFVQRIERLEEEKKALGADIREVYSEAKSTGFDTKIMRRVIALRKMDRAERMEQEALLQVYLDAIGEKAALI